MKTRVKVLAGTVMEATMSQEVWESIKPHEYVYLLDEPEGVGRVIVAYSGVHSAGGAIVRLRDGRYMKRTKPTVPLDVALVSRHARERKFVRASTLRNI